VNRSSVQLTSVWALALGLGLCALHGCNCGSEPLGQVGEECTGDIDCAFGLECDVDTLLCQEVVSQQSDAATGTDSASADTSQPDTGVAVDAAVSTDSAAGADVLIATDAAALPDSSVADAGAAEDTGGVDVAAAIDAGGGPDSGPFADAAAATDSGGATDTSSASDSASVEDSAGIDAGGPTCPLPGTAGTVSTATVVGDLNTPLGVAMDQSCNIFVADRNNNRIVLIDPSGTVSVFAGTGTPGLTNGGAASAEFSSPSGVAVDMSSGDLIVADTGNHALRRISAGVVSTLAGTGAPGFNNGAAGTAQFTNVSQVAVTALGDVLVADPVNNRIRMISAGTVSTAAGSGNPGTTNGAAATAEFTGPTGVAVSRDGTMILVSDTGNNLIRMVLSGTVSTLSGTGSPGYTEGAAGVAEFDGPRHIGLVQGSGVGTFTLYLADLENQVIRSVASDGSTALLAGIPQQAGPTDGVLTAAEFNDPFGLAVGPGGIIVVGDPNNDAVRLIFP